MSFIKHIGYCVDDAFVHKYAYEFRAYMGLEDYARYPIHDLPDKAKGQIFQEAVRGFATRLRENMYGESEVDLCMLPIERLVQPEPLSKDEQHTKLEELRERAELERLKKKYE